MSTPEVNLHVYMYYTLQLRLSRLVAAFLLHAVSSPCILGFWKTMLTWLLMIIIAVALCWFYLNSLVYYYIYHSAIYDDSVTKAFIWYLVKLTSTCIPHWNSASNSHNSKCDMDSLYYLSGFHPEKKKKNWGGEKWAWLFHAPHSPN